MLFQHRSFLRLFLLSLAFSVSFRTFGSLAFVSVTKSPRRATRQFPSTIRLKDNTVNDSAALSQEWTGVSNVLICGDGDLSYSAWLAEQLAEADDVNLTATVLESEEIHNSGAFYGKKVNHSHTRHQSLLSSSCLFDSLSTPVYKNSQKHSNRIQSFDRHEVCFGIDATRLSTHFVHTTFDRIIFNFPHWRGKANNKRNR